MKHYFSLFLKGAGMGAANVIPGVSGGTIALITGIFEELLTSIKSFDTHAVRLIFRGKFSEFSRYVHLDFLLAVFLGIGISIISLARLLGFLFETYPVQVWAYFFGLILASVYYVSATINRWNLPVILFFLSGTIMALLISFLSPATENQSFIYLFISGMVAMCSMILPGLSGSYVLVLMGEYELVMIHAVNEFRLDILIPVIVGAVVALLLFSRLLSWIYKKFRNQTIALLSGFIMGSLATIWPWKEAIYKTDVLGNPVFHGNGEPIIQGWRWMVPVEFNAALVITLLVMLAGVISMVGIEYLARNKNKPA
ncbi:MAG TPA: DUF368 domain-containing protein [Bacteroidetes bacterium]|nr:DUF368 domain-containing protein [Bacteroidota bacterium]